MNRIRSQAGAEGGGLEKDPCEEAFRALVVEDNAASRKMLEKLLQKAGYEVTTAADGSQGLELHDKGLFPIVITDWMLPEMDGLEFCRRLRARNDENYVYVIILTARDSKNDIITGLEAGADDYLVKPVHPAELIARLNTARRIIFLERSLRKRNEEIARLSITDPLTRIYNRGYFNKQLPAEIKRAVRHGRSLSLVMCDIDHFKLVNDRYGHQAGDEVLIRFADCLQKLIRESVDWVARYGGEEFVTVLPETDLQGACRAAERYRKKVDEMVVSLEDERITLTASFGVAVMDPRKNPSSATMHNLVSVADACLYQAKQEGRNRVVCRRL